MIRFTCEKTLLKGAIAAASRAVSSKSTIPALEGLLLHVDQDVTMSGYDTKTGIRARISADVTVPGDIVLNASLFGEIIQKMPDDTVVFSADDHLSVNLTCGDAHFEISGLSAEDYPDLPEVEDDYTVSIQRKILRAMIEETSFAISTNETRPVHTGALFEIEGKELTMAAVDGFRLAVRREPLEKTEGGTFSFVAPGAALNEVKSLCENKEEPVEITLGKRHILFHTGDKELICRRLEGEFLDYRKAIPQKNPIGVTADTRAMIESIDRVSVVISDKLRSPIRCVFGQDKAVFFAKTSKGEATDVCKIDGDGGGLEIGFNNRYLMDALRYAPADTVRIELNTGVSPAIVVPVDDSGKFLYMVLPVRLKNSEDSV